MSRDYDPVKAHEYYIAHRNLKGSKSSSSPETSTAGLSKKGKEVAKYVKEQIMQEKKAEVDAAREQMRSKIAAMRESFKSMTPEQKALKREELRTEINGMREEWKTTSSTIKQRYKDEYVTELAALKKQYPKVKSSKKKAKKLPWERK